ncbi:MAG: potassium/proton antiporter [Oscillospiraceae bacterium]|nr:potassium/proton antiporter [Oscillospiraceae bacterium]
MEKWIIIGSVLIVASILSSKLVYKFGIPVLLLFLAMGMFVGVDGPLHVDFEDAHLTESICSIALTVIMFYGGFGVNLKEAKRVAAPSILLSTVGVLVTAGITGIFTHWILGWSMIDSMLLGAVVSSTDAASVFSVLRSRKLSLKEGAASLLEIESGSNDPMSYMLTFLLHEIAQGIKYSPKDVALFFVKQFAFAVIIGVGIALVTVFLLKRINLEMDGLYSIFVLAMLFLCFSINQRLGGNGYLAVYLMGIILGNGHFAHRRSILHFFDGLSWLVQIGLFFILGLLSTPKQLVTHLGAALLCTLVLIVIARPIATAAIMTPFKFKLRTQVLVSWCGLRGAASIVFSTLLLADNLPISNTLFNIVFVVCLLSITLQGTFLPNIARKLHMVDSTQSIFKTFNDYPEESSGRLAEVEVTAKHPWAGKAIMDADIPESILVVMIHRDGKVVTPKGSTVMLAGDTVVLSGSNLEELERVAKGEEFETI